MSTVESPVKETRLSSFEQMRPEIEVHVSNINKMIEKYKVEGHTCSFPEMIWKRKNIYNLGQKSKRVLEIGFNAGHSAMHFLMSNPQLEIVCFDIGLHEYVEPCYQYLQEKFPGRITLIKGDSTKTVPQYKLEHPEETFDCLHIDGCHHPAVARQDIDNCAKLAHKESFMIFDDTNLKCLDDLWNDFVKRGKIAPVNLYDNGLFPTLRWTHSICKYRFP